MATTAQQDKLFEEICVQNQNFDTYEKGFQELLADIENDEALETFNNEYKTLHMSFLKCHEGEKRLIRKCADLMAEINSCALKVRSAVELSGADKNTIEQLKKEITKAKAKVSQSKETEITLKEKIKQLKVDIKELDKQVQRGAEGVLGHDTTLIELGRVRGDLQKEHDTQKAQLLAIQHDITHLEQRLRKAQDDKKAQDNELSALHSAIELKNQELEEQRSRKDRKERDLKGLKDELAKSNRQMIENQAAIAVSNADIDKLDRKVTAAKEEADKVGRELQMLAKQIKQVTDALKDCLESNSHLQKQATALSGQLKQKEGEVNSMRREQLKQAKLVDVIVKRNVVIESQRSEADGARSRLQAEIDQQSLAISSLTKQTDNDHKQIEDLTRERDILNKNYLKAQSATQRQKDWLVVKESQRRNLEHQIRGFERHAQKQQEIIHQLMSEAEQYERDAIEAALKFQAGVDAVKASEEEIVEKQKLIQEGESRLKQQLTLLDTVRNERALFTKQLQQLHSDIAEMRRKLKIMIAQIKQSKDEIQQKEKELLREEGIFNNLNRDKKQHEIQIDAYKNKAERREGEIAEYNRELHKLNQIIADADAEKARQKRDHVNVLNERDILGAQLIKRNDELAHLYEKIRIQQSSLRKGESQYNARLRDIQHLSLRIHQLRSELEQMRNFARRLPELKLLMNKGTRELTRERCRVRALLDECDNALNVHRWVVLEGSEPQTAEMIHRVMALQQELIAKSNEVAAKDRIVAEKEKMYVELKAIIQRQPGPEVAEQLNVYHDNLQKKTGQMKAMKASLRHFQEQVEHYKSQLDEMNGELHDINNAYLSGLKKQKREEAKRRAINEMLGRAADAPLDSDIQPTEYVGYTAPPRQPTDFDGTGTLGSVDRPRMGIDEPVSRDESPTADHAPSGAAAPAAEAADGAAHDAAGAVSASTVDAVAGYLGGEHAGGGDVSVASAPESPQAAEGDASLVSGEGAASLE